MHNSLKRLGQLMRQSAIVVAVLMLVTIGLIVQPSFADSLTPEEKIDRAYEESEATGIAEEIYQKRLQEGQNPEKLPQPYKRIVDLEGKEVPETSFIEKSVTTVRDTVEKITGNK